MTTEHPDIAMVEGKEDGHPSMNLWEIGAYLTVLTGTSFITAQLAHNGLYGPVANLLFVLSVAVLKASLVVGFFMHIKYEKAWKYFLCVPPCLLAITLVFVLLPDVAFKYYPIVTTWLQGSAY